MTGTLLVVNGIRLDLSDPVESAFHAAQTKLSKAGIFKKNACFSLYKRSVDARKKADIHFVCSVAVSADFSDREIALAKSSGFSVYSENPIDIRIGEDTISARPVIVGSGPCGLFASLLLAENGYRPILLERGGNMEERVAAVSRFSSMRILDSETNVQFGAGGAGTFSDGKLVTRIGDPVTRYVLERFVSFGADPSILTAAKPHIGTDVLRGIVERLLDRIVSLGGEVRFHTRFTSFDDKNGTVQHIKTNHGDIPCGALILALGHSARDTYRYLLTRGLSIEAKPFSVGMRIEHSAKDIDEAMYGADLSDLIGHAEYTLSHNTAVRGVYTFCMCPGGEVIAAASEENTVVVNGMSLHARNGKNDNSAVVCSIFKEDYGATPEKGIAFQQMIEKAAFTAGGGDYAVPLVTVGDFLSGKAVTMPKRVMPSYMGGNAFRLAEPETYLPKFVCDAIRGGLNGFDKKIHGFAVSDAILSGAETRTSAPLRILREEGSRLAVGFHNLYPAGEGAGYAGGITSAATDGIRTALALMAKYRPID